MTHIYKLYTFRIVGAEGDLLEARTDSTYPTKTKGESDVLFVFGENWTENPIALVNHKGELTNPTEIDKVLMGELEGNFLSWLADRPEPENCELML